MLFDNISLVQCRVKYDSSVHEGKNVQYSDCRIQELCKLVKLCLSVCLTLSYDVSILTRNHL